MDSFISSEDPLPIMMLLAELNSSSATVMVLIVLTMCTLLFLSALVSGSEVAFFSLTYQQRMECKTGQDKTNRKVAELLENPKKLLATMLIINNLFNITFVTLSTYLTWQITGSKDPKGLVIAIVTATITFLIVFFGEVVPKVYANQQGLKLAQQTVYLLDFFNKMVSPLSYLLLKMGDLIDNKIKKKGYTLSVEQLNTALEITTGNDATEEEKEILKGIVNFGTFSVKQIMKTRIDISAIDIETNFHDLIQQINQTGYSRMPVFKDTIDKIEGILYIKDLLVHLEEEKDFKWQNLLRDAYFVPENKKIDSLLKDFQLKHVHIAIVVDEYGGTSGLVTLEDIIEEVIGDINDEFDEVALDFSRIEDNAYLFEGKVLLNDFCKALEIPLDSFDEVKGDSESLGGLLLELSGALPTENDKLTYQNFSFEILEVNKRRITKVKVIVKDNTLGEIFSSDT